MIPTIITQLLAGKEEIKLGALTPTRDFNYVKDTAVGIIAIAESDKTVGEEINIATQQEISIRQLAEEIIRHINPNAKIAKIIVLIAYHIIGIWLKGNLHHYKTDIYNL